MKTEYIPADNYDGLLRQFKAMINLVNSMEHQRQHMMKTWHSPSGVKHLQELLESERDMNDKMTDEIDKLEQELAFLEYFYDHVDGALGPASDDIYEMIKEEYLEINGSLPEKYDIEEY